MKYEKRWDRKCQTTLERIALERQNGKWRPSTLSDKAFQSGSTGKGEQATEQNSRDHVPMCRTETFEVLGNNKD